MLGVEDYIELGRCVGARTLVNMGRWRLLAGLEVIVLLVLVQQHFLVAADEVVGQNSKYFMSMSFPNQVHGVVATRKVGDQLDKVCFLSTWSQPAHL